MRFVATIASLLVLAVAITLFVAASRWRAATAAVVARLRSSSQHPARSSFHPRDLEGVPAPVARYFRAVFRDGQSLIREARVVQRGEFLLRPPTGWHPFTAEELFTSEPPGFLWNARIQLFPGLHVFVRDQLIDGAGSMRGSVGGIVSVIDVHGTPEIAAGALHRYLAEAAWFPTALLPGHGVVWTAISETAARATMTVGSTSVWLDFHFGSDGFVASVYTPSRGREVNGRFVPTPWQGRFRRYEPRAGFVIPIEGEVEWVLPDGPQVYWKGQITGVTFTH